MAWKRSSVRSRPGPPIHPHSRRGLTRSGAPQRRRDLAPTGANSLPHVAVPQIQTLPTGLTIPATDRGSHTMASPIPEPTPTFGKVQLRFRNNSPEGFLTARDCVSKRICVLSVRPCNLPSKTTCFAAAAVNACTSVIALLPRKEKCFLGYIGQIAKEHHYGLDRITAVPAWNSDALVLTQQPGFTTLTRARMVPANQCKTFGRSERPSSFSPRIALWNCPRRTDSDPVASRRLRRRTSSAVTNSLSTAQLLNKRALRLQGCQFCGTEWRA